MRYIEPLGIVTGSDALRLIQSGKALPVAGHPKAGFTYIRVWNSNESSVDSCPVYQVGNIPEQIKPYIPVLSQEPPLADIPPGLQIMGILNLTPDSFSDGGRYAMPEKAVRAAMEMLEQGANIIDIGGESTRPGAQEISVQEELSRILPVVRHLCKLGVTVSVDTRRAQVMDAVLQEGVSVINDVSGLTFDSHAASVIARHKAKIILMHMRGTPKTMMDYTVYSSSVVYAVVHSLEKLVNRAVLAGVPQENILIDPGIGFAKTPEQDLLLLKHFSLLGSLGKRLVLGVSRKKFMTSVFSEPVASERDFGTIMACYPAFSLQHTILRVHNIKALHQAIQIWYGIT